jgi:hypothetical protein
MTEPRPVTRKPARATGASRRWAVAAAVVGAVLLAAELTLTSYALVHQSTSDSVVRPAGDAKTVYVVSFDSSRVGPDPACAVQPATGPQRTVTVPRHSWAAGHAGVLVHIDAGESLTCSGDSLYLAEDALARVMWLDPYGWLLLPAVVLLTWGLRRAFGVSLAFWLPRRWRANG